MINKLKILIILAAGSLMLMLGLAPRFAAADCSTTPASAQEAIQCGACNGAGTTSASCSQAADQSGQSVDTTVRNIINIFSVVAGVIAVIMIIAAGFRYITSAGAEQAVAGAKRTLMYAIIGLVIVALAQVIARFTLHTVTSPSKSGASSSGSPGGLGSGASH